jgi:hypothetical protein
MRVLKRRARRARANKKRYAGSPFGVAAGARLTFRAEVMPGRGWDERTFIVERVLAGGRVELVGLNGQHAVTEFEPAQPSGPA